MIMDKEPFDSQVRHALWHVIKQRPGIHFRALGRAAGVTSLGHLRHHLDHLERRDLVVEVEDGRYKRFFLTGEQPARVRHVLARLSRPVPRRIGRLLLARPMTRTELRRRLGCADSTLGYHLSRMIDLGDLIKDRNGNQCHYMLSEPEAVKEALAVQEGDMPHVDGPAPNDHHDTVLPDETTGPGRDKTPRHEDEMEFVVV